MSEWGGFTDDDLQRLKAKNELTSKPKIVKPIKKNVAAAEKRNRKQHNNQGKNEKKMEVPTQAMLSSKPATKQTPGTPPDSAALHGKTKSIENNDTKKEQLKCAENKENNIQIIDDEEVIQEKEKIKLEDVTKRQKEMEEKNKRRRDILSKAISERKKRANAESVKLKRIQAELSKLDEHLSFDVSILRDKIDEACYAYSAAKKHFEQTEAAYVTAKIDLNKHTEHKEELTEHLYHLIQLNEERKAKKLEELMEKLNLEEEEENNKSEEVVNEEKKTISPGDSKDLKPSAASMNSAEECQKSEQVETQHPTSSDTS